VCTFFSSALRKHSGGSRYPERRAAHKFPSRNGKRSSGVGDIELWVAFRLCNPVAQISDFALDLPGVHGVLSPNRVRIPWSRSLGLGGFTALASSPRVEALPAGPLLPGRDCMVAERDGN
jgi:hypothetical protein